MLAPTSFMRGSSVVPFTTSAVLKLLVAPLVGALLGTMVMWGLVYSQTRPPATNPVSEPVLTYGD
jgi:hypothetical protein